MLDILYSEHRITAKVAFIGPAGSGKGEILQALSSMPGSGPLHQHYVGETEICRCSWEWTGIPEPNWTFDLSAYATVGEVEFNGVTEMLLEGVDGIIFIVPIDPSRADEIKTVMQTLAFNMSRYGRYLGDIPLVLHYHRAERMPDFDPVMLDDLLGIKGDVIPRFVTRSEGDDLTVSLDSVVEQILEGIDLSKDGN